MNVNALCSFATLNRNVCVRNLNRLNLKCQLICAVGELNTCRDISEDVVGRFTERKGCVKERYLLAGIVGFLSNLAFANGLTNVVLDSKIGPFCILIIEIIVGVGLAGSARLSCDQVERKAALALCLWVLVRDRQEAE